MFDEAPSSGGKPSTDALMAENCDEANVDGASVKDRRSTVSISVEL